LGTGKEGEKGNKRARGKTKLKEKEVKGERRGVKEKGTKGRENGKGGILYSCDFSLDKTLQ